jgi:uncharacterized protein YbaR (Trm112 family)
MYLLKRSPVRAFFVRSTEIIPCPCCAGELQVIGSRRRVWIQSDGVKNRLVIRRTQCEQCGKIHHELPALLVPYKHYDAESIEAALSGSEGIAVAADESTLLRWRSWFAAWIVYAQGVLTSLSRRFDLPVDPSSTPAQSVLHVLGRFVGTAPGLLSRAVRPIANSHAWVTDPVCLLVH